MSFFEKLFDASDFTPRWTCGTWTPFEGWLHILSDMTLFAAYMAIPLLLLVFVRRAHIQVTSWRVVAFLFATFVCCGFTYAADATMFWWPAYRLNGLIHFGTAVISVVTVGTLLPIIPKMLMLHSDEEMRSEVMQRVSVEKQLQTLRESTIDSIIVADANGIVQHFNSAAERMFGVSAKTIVGQSVARFIPAEIREKHERAMARYVATRTVMRGRRVLETTALRANGEKFLVEISLGPFVVGANDYFTAVIRDSSHRQKQEEQLQKNLIELRDQIQKCQLLEVEIALLRSLQEAQITPTIVAINKLNTVRLNLTRLMGDAPDADSPKIG